METEQNTRPWRVHVTEEYVLVEFPDGREALLYGQAAGDLEKKIEAATSPEEVIEILQENGDWSIEAEIEEYPPATCGACGGPLIPLGNLGRITHYRCRNCGSMAFRDPGGQS